MSREFPRGLDSSAFVRRQEKLTGGKPIYTIPFADGTGKVVFRGLAAETASLLLGLQQGEKLSKNVIGKRFDLTDRSVRSVVNAVREGLEVAGVNTHIVRNETQEYYLTSENITGKNIGGKSKFYKGKPAFEITSERGKILQLDGQSAVTFDELWNASPETNPHISPEEAKHLEGILNEGKTRIRVIKTEDSYRLDIPPGRKIDALWVIDIDKQPLYKPKRSGDVFVAENHKRK